MIEMLVVQGMFVFFIVVIDIFVFGFLNLGVQLLFFEFGVILVDGLDVVYLVLWNVVVFGMVIFFMVLFINIVGDGLCLVFRKRVSY